MDTELSQFLGSLPLEERIAHYRQYAQEAMEKAASIADQDLRTGFLNMAAGWHTLADEIEQTLEKLDSEVPHAGAAQD